MSYCSISINDSWQLQEFDKPLFASEAVCGSSPLLSTAVLPSHHDLAATGCLPHRPTFTSEWSAGAELNHGAVVVFPWWNETSGCSVPSVDLLNEPRQQHLTVRIAAIVIVMISKMCI